MVIMKKSLVKIQKDFALNLFYCAFIFGVKIRNVDVSFRARPNSSINLKKKNCCLMPTTKINKCKIFFFLLQFEI